MKTSFYTVALIAIFNDFHASAVSLNDFGYGIGPTNTLSSPLAHPAGHLSQDASNGVGSSHISDLLHSQPPAEPHYQSPSRTQMAL